MHRFLAACSLLFLLPFSARASGPAFISEVAWAGSSASLADEWFELCGAPGADLSGWSIDGAASAPIVLPAGSLIPASGAYLIANYAADDARSTLSSAPDLVTTSVSLSNSALALTLRDPGGAAVDAAGTPGSPPPAGTSGAAKASMERVDLASWTTSSLSSGFDPGATEFGTPGTCATPEAESAPEVPAAESATTSGETAPPPEAPAPQEPKAVPEEPMGAVRVSEIYPSPNAGEHEWIELLNPSAVGEFLDGWTVEDRSGTRTSLDGLLMPWTRAVIASPKGSLNNDGDLVVLKDRFGRVVERVEYPKTAKGSAFAREELQGAFAMTTAPTPGAANVFTSAEAEAIASGEPTSMETPSSSLVSAPKPAPQHVVLSEAKDPSPIPERDPSAPLRSAQDDRRTVKPSAKKPAKPKAAAASRYKGTAYVATVIVPPGVYAKTRAYVQRGSAIEELRLSKAPSSAWNVGDRIAFVAQEKSEGAVAFLLANPNSVRTVGSASATFASAEAWPEAAGGYSFIAEIASIRGDALEVKLAGVEGDVLTPIGVAAALKPGDTVRVEGFIASGPRPKVVLPYAGALRLFKTRLPDDVPSARTAKLPASLALGLTAAAAGVGLIAYLRMQRLKRLALTQAPLEESAWE